MFDHGCGLVSACSDFFQELIPGATYRFLVVLFSVICAVVANVGLTQLLAISIPVLMTIYPVAIALVLVTFLTPYFRNPKFAHRLALSVALFFGIFDALKVTVASLKPLTQVAEPNSLLLAFVSGVESLAPVMSALLSTKRAWPGCHPPDSDDYLFVCQPQGGTGCLSNWSPFRDGVILDDAVFYWSIVCGRDFFIRLCSGPLD